MGISDIMGDFGCIAIPGMERYEVYPALTRLCARLSDDLWQFITIVDKDSCGCTTLKTQSEVVARIKFEVKDSRWLSASIRTDLLPKYRTLFHEEFYRLELSFERLQPYLCHN